MVNNKRYSYNSGNSKGFLKLCQELGTETKYILVIVVSFKK